MKGGGGLRRAGFASTEETVKVAVSSAFFEVVGLNAGADIEALQLLPVGADQARFESVAARRRELGDDRPIFLGDELLDLEFAIANEGAARPIARGRPSGRAAACATAPATA